MQQTAFGRVIAGFIIVAAVPAFAGEGKPSRTVISGDPWVPSPPGATPKIIYGSDDRIDVYQETDPQRLGWAASTCALMSSSSLTSNPDGSFNIRTSAYGVCPDEPFANQPTAAFCSGFMVGPDLIATAGHCYDSGDIGNARFVFGYVMLDANNAVLNVDAEYVYTGVELVGQALSGDLDYAVVRVDRNITAPGAVPFEIRREGVVPVGANVGVIGHPSGLPMKIAFGDNTVVRNNSNPSFFVANLDTYGGNSGSPVINPLTGIVEGILVRGDTDFIFDGGCMRSNVVSNTGGRGEDVTKTSVFADIVPQLISGDGAVTLDRETYGCNDMLTVTLRDSDLAGEGSATVSIETSGGDMESVVLSPGMLSGEFSGMLEIAAAAPVPGDGALQTAEGETITVIYLDAMHGPDAPDEVTATATVDCTPPGVENVEVTMAGSQFAIISFTTTEPASGFIRVGESCGEILAQAPFILDTDHRVTVTGLLPLTAYRFHITLEDEAGNPAVANNGGACFELNTVESVRYYTEAFGPGRAVDLANLALTFIPDGNGSYDVCRESIASLPVDSTGATPLVLGDDATVQVSLEGKASVVFQGIAYSSLFVNSNGNITFESGDSSFGTSIEEHFDAPRVSPFFCDLNPAAGGQVWHKSLSDRFVVTWNAVPRFSSSSPNTMQVELFTDGRIRFSYRGLTAGTAFVGLSAGLGLMPDFVSDDFSASQSCTVSGDRFHSADTDQNNAISLQELLRIIQFYNLDGYHCDPAGEDGYATGPGAEDCDPHDIDYNPQDWQVSLSEVLRLVQFFNAAGYSHDPGAGTEDGFVPLVAR